MESSPQSPARDRLPTLFEVLNRRTLPPVDLYSFYVFMRDQQLQVDYLDFWLDIAQHLSLCRLYVRQLRESLLIETPDIDGKGSPHSSMVLDALKVPKESLSPDEKNSSDESRRVSMIMRSESLTVAEPYSQQDIISKRNSAVKQHQDRQKQLAEQKFGGEKSEELKDSEERRLTLTHSAGSTVTRLHVKESAYGIMATYLVPGAECELALPLHITRGITTSIEVDGRDDPEVFEEAKEYVFQAMEREAFPAFLEYKALGNLSPAGAITRLFIGLFSLFAAFWVAFILIFLDYHKTVRLWLILPFSIGIYGCLSYQYYLDPIFVFSGYSELTYFKYHKLREPYVKSLLVRRAVWVMGVAVLLIICLCVLFGLVPGRRL
ncbi:putative RGS domain protein [Myxozyma melibiosi]|uniref:RGS domain protein n=1 Tax=Myxozyma melibiosi TaxID=54550 RepID=A0ABR1F2H9_9ASCO